MQKLDSTNQKYGLLLNTKKTPVIITNRSNRTRSHNLGDKEVIINCICLGSLTTNSGGCEEIKVNDISQKLCSQIQQNMERLSAYL